MKTLKYSLSREEERKRARRERERRVLSLLYASNITSFLLILNF